MTKALFAVLALFTGLAQAAPIAAHAPAKDSLATTLVANVKLIEVTEAPHFTFEVECVGNCGGTGGWTEVARNTVVTAGKNSIIDLYFRAGTCPAAWYLMLKGTGTIAAGDTMASHGGWAEVTPYAGNRPALTFAAASNGSSAATQVSYTINGSATVAGACITTTNTGSTGTLYSCTDFSGSRAVVSGDTLNVTPTVSF